MTDEGVCAEQGCDRWDGDYCVCPPLRATTFTDALARLDASERQAQIADEAADYGASVAEPSPEWAAGFNEGVLIGQRRLDDEGPVDNPTMLDIVRALSDNYTPDGVAIVLASPNKHFPGFSSLAAACCATGGRLKVYAWAYSLGEMIAT